MHTHAHWAYTFIYFGIGRRIFATATKICTTVGFTINNHVNEFLLDHVYH